MNNTLARVLGENTPVPAASKRSQSARERSRKQVSRAVSGVLGVMEGDVIPDDAVDIDSTAGTSHSIAGLSPVKDFKLEPVDPYTNGEKVYSPATALVAPDVTPNATKPLDPSQMPGVSFGSFTGAQAEPPPAAQAQPAAAPSDAQRVNAMDILLGRGRGSAATASPATVERTDNVPVTEEAAAAMLGLQSSFTSAPVMEAGVPQPPPQEKTDIKHTCEVARRWMA